MLFPCFLRIQGMYKESGEAQLSLEGQEGLTEVAFEMGLQTAWSSSKA